MSGIYIPGMEMPKSCFECNLKKIWEDGVQCLVNKGLWMDCDSKHKACPLIPVQEHGALIDRDDFFATCPELVCGYKHITDDLVVIPADKEGEG